MEYVLTNLLSQLALLVFVIMILTAIVGGRPEAVAKAFLDLIGAVIVGAFKLLGVVVESVFGLAKARQQRRTSGLSPKERTD